jgi:hypothetical protein
MAHAHDDNLVHKQTDYDRGRAQENVVDDGSLIMTVLGVAIYSCTKGAKMKRPQMPEDRVRKSAGGTRRRRRQTLP